MEPKRYYLWSKAPGTAAYEPSIDHYAPTMQTQDGALLIIPGSAYRHDPARPTQEGARVAEYFCRRGLHVFVLRYRVKPDMFPLPILDGRRAIRFLRHRAEAFGFRADKIAAMGYSSGGHLTASLWNYPDPLPYEGGDEVDEESFLPDYQILCYPVIGMKRERAYTHQSSTYNLPGDRYEELGAVLSHEDSTVPIHAPTFLWHNFDDSAVHVQNTLRYAESLKQRGVSVELHIFPDGGHGIGLPVEDSRILNHDRQWIDLLVRWMVYQGFLKQQTEDF